MSVPSEGDLAAWASRWSGSVGASNRLPGALFAAVAEKRRCAGEQRQEDNFWKPSAKNQYYALHEDLRKFKNILGSTSRKLSWKKSTPMGLKCSSSVNYFLFLCVTKHAKSKPSQSNICFRSTDEYANIANIANIANE